MNKSSAGAGLIIGLALIYVSIFGLVAPFSLLSLTPGLQDFTTYTKVDSGNYYSVTLNTVTVTNMPRSSTSTIYKNFGSID